MATQSMTFLNIMYSGLGVHDIILRQYKEFKGERYFGTYWPITGEPILTLLDLDLVQDVMGEQGHEGASIYDVCTEGRRRGPAKGGVKKCSNIVGKQYTG